MLQQTLSKCNNSNNLSCKLLTFVIKNQNLFEIVYFCPEHHSSPPPKRIQTRNQTKTITQFLSSGRHQKKKRFETTFKIFRNPSRDRNICFGQIWNHLSLSFWYSEFNGIDNSPMSSMKNQTFSIFQNMHPGFCNFGKGFCILVKALSYVLTIILFPKMLLTFNY